MKNKKPQILITGATGQIGGATLRLLQSQAEIEPVAAVRSPAKAAPFEKLGIRTVQLDFDREETLAPALAGIERVFLATGYTVDMLRQSKVFLDRARQAGVRHVVHLGACGRDDTTVTHWAWHQLIERYIEWSGFSFTHLRPECFMQNLLNYDGVPAVKNGVIRQYTSDAPFSWVDGDDVAQAAALALLHPERHGGQTYRMGYDVKSYGEIAAMMTEELGQPFRYEAQDPQVFLDEMRATGAEMAYMSCVYDNFRRMAARDIPGVDEVFDNFPQIAGREPMRLRAFIRKHRDKLAY
ncbi:SDR family oxidoreductase [Serratia marcescens]|uniref:SDR family oxidoreductase n=1 Tax=Serratia marcescens TaxID=615 RepID=UPI001DC630AE|nr:SDR family oxidoreductase [Serratia marcescens]MBN5186362.1 SDR family oxidoreductase [Serratia marcescens]MBN5195029.1 SDR family oxidoreductase [Serratia marcescens]WVJ44292.1 SDR family oxidoreductase [Serratia marcescens]BEO23222.1 NAD(P)-dependent oxidoreductase [Serratia marcescens]